MLIAKTLSYYKRTEVQKLLVEASKDKEIAFKFRYGFGKRPDTLKFDNDVLELAKKGMSSLHCSEELWSNPLKLDSRKGWDLVIDIDCKFFEYSKLTTDYIVKAFKHCGVKKVGVKFSGNKGFHIGIPWESFPKKIKGEQVSEMFPEAPKKIAEYVKFLIEKPLRKEILEKEGNDLAKISENTGIPVDKLKVKTSEGLSINTDLFIEIDTLLISSRHLYRMPYSFHEKSGLISLPISSEKVLEFDKESANPETAKLGRIFLDRTEEGDAEDLLVRALDHSPDIEEKKIKKEYVIPEEAIPEKFFPPCWFNLKKGLKDGKKRMLFATLNFLSSMGWGEDQIREVIGAWNKKHLEPLRDNYLESQLSYHFRKKPVLPPNCDSDGYYKTCGVCTPDNLCSKIKNPAQYAKRKTQQ
jgi:hypothetical protein